MLAAAWSLLTYRPERRRRAVAVAAALAAGFGAWWCLVAGLGLFGAGRSDVTVASVRWLVLAALALGAAVTAVAGGRRVTAP
ncbi:hypothetical protein [Pimelobacter sp. 30-1]|uniref:hypothetical protein n=1 Tax=Pimelobacter sp. 30-1 TaxID=2004991 RepID=UPI001C042A5E|nr:hypothetical protein [Pimelobacter sp. 30-1]MBU2697313.1 hypothetical protein [Pimelobacter sp. 30-1]